MNNIAEEIEGSTQGGALAADNGASPYSLTNLRDIICDIRLIVSQYSKYPTVCWDTKEMFVGKTSASKLSAFRRDNFGTMIFGHGSTRFAMRCEMRSSSRV